MSDIELHTVDFSSMDLYEIPFNDITSVEKLLLDCNELCDLLPVSRWNSIAEHLRILSISRNHLQSIPDDICMILSACLQHLDVSENELSDFPANFGALNALSRLIAEQNQLDHLPDSFCQLHSMTELNLSGNQLKHLPDGFGSLRSLTKLNLSCNSLGSLPDSFAELDAVEDLDLCQNRLSHLPSTFASSARLKLLSLGSNLLSELPDWVNHLRCIEDLSLFENDLSGCPFSLEFASECRTLTHLNLSGNSITSLPENFGALNSLDSLYLGTCARVSNSADNLQDSKLNAIAVLPNSFCKLTKLQTLCMDCNMLRELPDSFGELKRLEHLDLSNNHLSQLPASFGDLQCLKFCILNGNELVELPDSLRSLSNLDCLLLASNQLSCLPQCLASLDCLEELDVHQNQITALPEYLLTFQRLHRIDAEMNPFEDRRKAEEMLKKLKKQETIDSKCAYSTSDLQHRTHLGRENCDKLSNGNDQNEEFRDDDDSDAEETLQNGKIETSGEVACEGQKRNSYEFMAAQSGCNSIISHDPQQLFIPSQHHIQVEPVWPAFKKQSSNSITCDRRIDLQQLKEQGVFEDAENDTTD